MPRANTASKNEPPKKKTKEILIEVTARLFAAHGVAGTSLEQIAREAKVAKASVLWHFKDKETLLLETIAAVIDRWEAEITDELMAVEDSKARLEGLFLHYKKLVRERPEILQLFMVALFEALGTHPEVTGRFRQMYRSYRAGISLAIQLGVQDGTFAEDIEPERVAALIIAGFDGVFIQHMLERDEEVPLFQVEAAIDLIQEQAFAALLPKSFDKG